MMIRAIPLIRYCSIAKCRNFPMGAADPYFYQYRGLFQSEDCGQCPGTPCLLSSSHHPFLQLYCLNQSNMSLASTSAPLYLLSFSGLRSLTTEARVTHRSAICMLRLHGSRQACASRQCCQACFWRLGFIQCGVAQPRIASNGPCMGSESLRWPCMGSS